LFLQGILNWFFFYHKISLYFPFFALSGDT